MSRSPKAVDRLLTIVAPEGVVSAEMGVVLHALALALAPLVAAELQGLAVAAAAKAGSEVTLSGARRLAKVAPRVISKAIRLPDDHPGHLPSRVVGSAHGSATGERRAILIDRLLEWVRAGGPASVRASF